MSASSSRGRVWTAAWSVSPSRRDGRGAPMTSTASQASWTPDDLHELDRRRELEVAAPLDGGGRGSWTPIWVVVADGQVFVRTWRRRKTGWYGRAVSAERAWIRMPAGPVDVRVEAVGSTGAHAIDDAYRRKYGTAAAESMVSAEAAASTLRLSRLS